MAIDNENKETNFEDLINNMSSINSEDYWFTKISKIEEHDETLDSGTASPASGQGK